MVNYFRITAYHPEKYISVILDSNGMFEKLWQFSSYLVQKGFKILEVGIGENLVEGTFPMVSEAPKKILLRGINKGKPKIQELVHKGKLSKAIKVYDKAYGLLIQ